MHILPSVYFHYDFSICAAEACTIFLFLDEIIFQKVPNEDVEVILFRTACLA